MEQAEQNFKQLLHKLSVTRHYLHLFESELDMVVSQPSLLEYSLDSIRFKDQITKIIEACRPLHLLEERVQSLSWYTTESFRAMEGSLDVLQEWIKQLAYVETVALAQPFFYTLLDQDRSKSYGILVDLFGSLQVARRALNEEYLRLKMS